MSVSAHDLSWASWSFLGFMGAGGTGIPRSPSVTPGSRLIGFPTCVEGNDGSGGGNLRTDFGEKTDLFVKKNLVRCDGLVREIGKRKVGLRSVRRVHAQ